VKCRALAVAVVALGCSASATPAAAESGRLADFAIALPTTAPASPTGVKVHVQFHREGDPDAKPSPIRTAVLALPVGLRFDTTAVPECTATDDEIRSLGADACPKETELTVGTLVGMTGFGPPADPITGDDHVFNGPRQLIEIISAQGSSASPAFDRLMIDGSTLTAHPPVTPGGPPDGETAVRSIDFEVPVRAEGGKSLITTPPDCPAGERWTSTGTFGFADGSSDTVVSATPCARNVVAKLPRLRLSARPRHVRVGRATRVRFRAAATDPACLMGARVRFAGRTVRVGPRGRASLRITFHRPGLRRARVTSPGCRPALARVRVVRARQPSAFSSR
jgi:hypothetical protein